jgi:predicted nucleic acid-binding protein
LIYADTSFFVSVYLTDPHSSRTQALLSPNPEVCVTPLHRAEWAHAIEQHVFRKTLSSAEALQLHRKFERDCVDSWISVSMPDSSFARCEDLARRHAAQIGMRTLDTLHVAVALELSVDSFWSFDERQTKLAKMSGLRTI